MWIDQWFNVCFLFSLPFSKRRQEFGKKTAKTKNGEREKERRRKLDSLLQFKMTESDVFEEHCHWLLLRDVGW